MWNKILANILIACYGLLLLVNVIEIRSGLLLAFLQFVLGSGLIFGLLFCNLSWFEKYRSVRPILTFFFILSLVAGLVLNWFNAPNHLYLFTLLTLVLAFGRWDTENPSLPGNFRWLFILLMGAATLYKFINPEFINGNFTGYMFAQRKFFAPVFASGLFPEINSQLLGNREIIIEVLHGDPQIQKDSILAIDSIPMMAWARHFRSVIIGGELILTLLFLVMPTKKVSYISLLIFVLSIGLIVPEFEFASTLLFMGLVMCPREYKFLKKSYLYSFLIYVGLAIAYNFFQYVRHLV